MNENKSLLVFLMRPLIYFLFKIETKKYKSALKSLRIDLKGKNIINVGCKKGALCNALKEYQPNEIIGVGCSKRCVEVARIKVPDLTFLYANSCEIIPFDDLRFDIVISSFTLKRFKKQNRLHMYQEMKRVACEYIIILDEHDQTISEIFSDLKEIKINHKYSWFIYQK